MRNFLNRPLTMNVWANALLYGGIMGLTNLCLEILFNAGFATMLLVAIFITILSRMENNWVEEILTKTG